MSERIIAIIPAYDEEAHLEAVLRAMPARFDGIVVVIDGARDRTQAIAEACRESDARIELVVHHDNRGVGAAMISGFARALQLAADIVVKVDADGQAPLDHLDRLLVPLLERTADVTKGNRFHDRLGLRVMPLVRRLGNLGLSFLTKAASGYWNVFDPTNGFVALRKEALTRLEFTRLSPRYFFEISLLSELYLIDAVVRDVPTPARYGAESSKLSVARALFEFPPKLALRFVRRLVQKCFLYDFNIKSVYLLLGFPMVLGATIYGSLNWFRYHLAGVGAPTGTVVIPTLLIIMGFQLLLQALVQDLRDPPRDPLCGAKRP